MLFICFSGFKAVLLHHRNLSNHKIKLKAMTNQDANTIEKKIKQLACDIAEKIESMLNGDFIDVYFYICDYDTLEVDYSFQRDSGTIMTVTAQSQEFFASECDGYVEPAGIEQELEMNANQHIC